MNLLTTEDLKNEENRKLFKHISVVDRIESYLQDTNLKKTDRTVTFRLGSSWRPKGLFAASMIGEMSGKTLCKRYPMGCARKLYFAYNKVEGEGFWEPVQRRRLDTGTAIHALIQSYLADYANEHRETDHFECEVIVNPANNEVADKYDLTGHVDGVYQLQTPDGPVRFGIEFKTISDAGFKATNGPHAEHIMQGTVYQKCLDLPVMLFVYWNINDCSLAEYIQPFDNERWEAIAEKLNMVRACAMREELPEGEYSYNCRTCLYRGICKPPRLSSRPNPALFKHR